MAFMYSTVLSWLLGWQVITDNINDNNKITLLLDILIGKMHYSILLFPRTILGINQ